VRQNQYFLSTGIIFVERGNKAPNFSYSRYYRLRRLAVHCVVTTGSLRVHFPSPRAIARPQEPTECVHKLTSGTKNNINTSSITKQNNNQQQQPTTQVDTQTTLFCEFIMTVLTISTPQQPILTVNAVAATTSLPLSPFTTTLFVNDDGDSVRNDSDGGNFRLVIVQPPILMTDTNTSYSWEDFPVIIQEENPYSHLVSSSTSDSSMMLDDDVDSSSSSLSLSSMSDDDDEEEYNEHDVVPNDTTVISSSPTTTPSLSPTIPSKRRVRFASALEVRTYSVVLGDHPLCESLPLSLGWGYDPTPCWVDLETHEDSKNSHYHCHNSTIPYRYHGKQQQHQYSHTVAAAHGVYRLSYLERKQLLMQVGGYSAHQLMVEERMIQQQGHLGTDPSMLQRLKHSQRSDSLQHMVRDEE
jgi:hypothetical protein